MCIRDSDTTTTGVDITDNITHVIFRSGNFDFHDRLKKNRSTLLPVSYTHLDVYKRQVLGMADGDTRGDGCDEYSASVRLVLNRLLL